MFDQSNLQNRIKEIQNNERLEMTANTKLKEIQLFLDKNPELSEFTSFAEIAGCIIAFVMGMPNPVYINKLNEIQNASPEIYTDFKTILDEALKAWIEWSNATKENT
jgi:hypothetical protein